MKKEEIIAAIEAASVEGIVVNDSMKVDALTRVYNMVASEETIAEAEATIGDLKLAITQKDETLEQYAKDIETLNAALQTATDVNTAIGVVPNVKVDEKNYIIKFGVSTPAGKFDAAQIAANEPCIIDEQEIGIAEYLVKIESPALQLIGA
jgi:uncharacterized coiled-coil protein SlyX